MSKQHWVVLLAWIEWLQDMFMRHSPQEMLSALRAANAALAAGGK